MPLRSGLAAYFYTLAGATGRTDYAGVIEDLTFSSVSPGGCGDLDAKIKLANVRLPYPELAAFARIAIVGQGQAWWSGELTDPELTLNDTDGDWVHVQALGIGNALRDDPITTSYSAKTVQQIAIDQLTAAHGGLTRTNFLPLDSDTSAMFPDNPAGTFTLTYPARTMEEVYADLCTLAGDYVWGVWPHPLGNQPNATGHTDTAGFPTAQIQIHKRDTSTIAYTALLEADDIKDWRIIPSGERAYNVVQIAYNDPAQNPPVGIATYTDPRLAANGSQGSAPFRRRVYFRDLSGTTTVTKAQAQAIANAYGALFQNVTNRIELTLRGVHDANGNPLPLHQVRADSNIFVPALSVRGPTLPTAALAGTNLFYIREAKYEETATDMALTLQCDNFVDTPATRIARLQLQADAAQRAGAGKTTGAVQALGAPITCEWSVEWGGYALAGNHVGKDFSVGGTAMTQAPTSITWTAATSGNSSAPTANNFGVYGAHAFVSVTANGAGFWIGSGATVGN